ncbi:MAG: hypothetical protein V7609_2098 [Verrucomicrobiota bacterium]
MNAHPLGLHLESVRFASREVLRNARRAARAVLHRELVTELQIGPAVALANHQCQVIGAELRSAINKHAHSLRQL